MTDTPSEGELAPTGILSMEVPRMGIIHKQWFEPWPPPQHLAVARVKPAGRPPVVGVLDAVAWVTDQGFMPNAQVVWIYDQVSVSDSEHPEPPDWMPHGTPPLLPAAFYKRRDSVMKIIRGGENDGS